MAAIRIGQFVGAPDLLDWLGGADKLRRIASWENGKSPKASDSIKAAARGAGLCLEPVFDAAHGFRYLCFVYRDWSGRAACWAALTGD